MPDIKWIGAHPNNYTAGRNGLPVIGVVLHVMEGALTSTDGWFNNPAAQASTNYGIGKDGAIHQYVNEKDSAYGNGIVESPDRSVAFINKAVSNNWWMNGCTISIEHEGVHTEQATEAQYQSTLGLVKAICERYGIPKDRNGICGHNQIQKYGRANCPGSMVNWNRLFSDLKGQTVTTPLSKDFDSVNLLTGKPEKLFVSGAFLEYWTNYGGLEVFGMPVTPEIDAAQLKLDFAGSVQVFERARFEFHNQDGRVYLGRVGAEWLALKAA